MIDIAASFQKFCEEIHLHSDTFMVSLKGIAKKLNKKYYKVESELEHLHIVGSIGRGTAVAGVSDIDVIFELPQRYISVSMLMNRTGNLHFFRK